MEINCKDCGGKGRYQYYSSKLNKQIIVKCIRCNGKGTYRSFIWRMEKEEKIMLFIIFMSMLTGVLLTYLVIETQERVSNYNNKTEKELCESDHNITYASYNPETEEVVYTDSHIPVCKEQKPYQE